MINVWGSMVDAVIDQIDTRWAWFEDQEFLMGPGRVFRAELIEEEWNV